MSYIDSIDKVVQTYFSKVCTEEFTYKKKVYKPKALYISPLIFRDFICHPGCGGCCPRFSLDYLPSESRPDYIDTTRTISLNGKEFEVYSDKQDDHRNPKCRNLDLDSGLCKVHASIGKGQPFSCDFEIIRFMEFRDEKAPNRLLVKNFGRGWAMMRVDGNRGALCEVLPESEAGKLESIRKIKRLKEWCDYFQIKNKCDSILEYLESGPHTEPIIV